MAGKAAAAEAPPVADAVVRHAPLHGAPEVGERLGRQRIDRLGDAALRLRQACDVREDRLVAARRFRGACPAGHSFRQRGVDLDWCRSARGRFLDFPLTDLLAGHGYQSKLSPSPETDEHAASRTTRW